MVTFWAGLGFCIWAALFGWIAFIVVKTVKDDRYE